MENLTANSLTRTSQIQSDFARFCKTGDVGIQIPGAGKNLIQYHFLMHNIMIDTIDSNFPLAKKIVKKKDWKNLLNDFIINHNCSSAQVWTMPREFYEFVLAYHSVLLEKYPTLRDLLWFDWVDTEIFMMEDRVVPSYQSRGNVKKSKLVVNPEIEIFHFNYPVFKMKPKKITNQDFDNYYLVFYRNLETGDVNYWEIPPAYVRLLEVLQEIPYTAMQAAEKVCEEAQIVFSKDVENKSLAFVEECLEKQIILGFL